ncbi:PEPxxWA-CTERM sorting domain-containing protein (plasmid) [Polymorphobacter sp. PAMC 29334]|nr:PEPxxWA-CTERM sorting domain-containing protein [Polymorphobacter sp. PAMC 29334]
MVSGLGCWQTTTPVLLVPLVGKNLTGSTLDFSTVVLPTNVLLVHPGQSTDSIVRFTAPTTGKYNVSGFFELLDTHPTGVNAIIAFDNTVVFDQMLSGPGALSPSTPGGLVPFGANGILLHAGDFLDYGVNNAGNFYNDSTGLSLTFAAVPEPASWALMIVGFGLVGFSARRRTNAVAA